MFKTFLTELNTCRYVAFSLENKRLNETAKVHFRPAILFILTVFLYSLYQAAMQPGWVLGGEMWAEMATNYFPNANSGSYVTKFFATDAGYIPMPQRIIAFIGNLFAFPASSIPYFYTWSSIILTAMLVGVFCLTPFQYLIKSDFLRFIIVLSVLIVADFETRTFINFTYYVTFFAAIITALALVENSEEIPVWSWFLPILMVSKPTVLSALPMMIVVSLISKSRFRWIVILTVILSIGQFIQMLISHNSGVMALQSNKITLGEKLIATIEYFFGLLGKFLFGSIFPENKYFLIVLGILSFSFIIFLLKKARKRANALIIVGILILFFNILLNCFVLNIEWNTDMAKLSTFSLNRQIIAGFFGSILIISGIIGNLSETTKKYFSPIMGVIFFTVWFFLSGWFSFGIRISHEPTSPMLNNSQWQNLASTISSSEPVVCVPIDPFSWGGGIYGRNCSLLNPEMNWGQEYRKVDKYDENFMLEVMTPPWVSQRTLISVGILLRPLSTQTAHINAKALVLSADGTQQELRGERLLSISGGMLLLSGQLGTSIKGATSIKFIFNVPVEIRFITNVLQPTPAILWMGN